MTEKTKKTKKTKTSKDINLNEVVVAKNMRGDITLYPSRDYAHQELGGIGREYLSLPDGGEVIMERLYEGGWQVVAIISSLRSYFRIDEEDNFFLDSGMNWEAFKRRVIW